MSGDSPLAALRARLGREGAAALSEAELIALVLREGGRRGALEGAESLARGGGRWDRVPAGALAREAGLGRARAASLAAAAELGRRLAREDTRARVPDARSAAALLPEGLRGARKEHFQGLYLDARSGLIRQETISVGTLSASLVHPREVFAPALACAAASLLVCHNHPSGDPAPSAEDREVTRRLRRAGEILGLPLLDHVIVAERGWFSFRESGLL